MTSSEDARAYEVFVSYSHTDEPIVTPIVNLLRSVGSKPFRDKQNIKPGKKWRTVISEAIEDCRLMWVFWCSHSQESREVQREYLRAVELDKDVVPVLLDSTPLPKPLSEFQWIDMRDALRSHDRFCEQLNQVAAEDVGEVISEFKSEGMTMETTLNANGTYTVSSYFPPEQEEIERGTTHLLSWLEKHVTLGS